MTHNSISSIDSSSNGVSYVVVAMPMTLIEATGTSARSATLRVLKIVVDEHNSNVSRSIKCRHRNNRSNRTNSSNNGVFLVGVK